MFAQGSSVFRLLEGSKQFTIPIYQRRYSWETEECQQLWEDIKDMVTHNLSGHFIGAVVSVHEEQLATAVQLYELVDGQQRTTTIILLLLAIRDFIKENNLVDENIPDAHAIEGKYLINQYEKGEKQYKLMLKDEDQKDLVNLLNGKTDFISESNIKANYDFFKQMLKKSDIPLGLIFDGLGKLKIVDIMLNSKEDNAQGVFESLNSKGKNLSTFELIQNFILMSCLSKTEEQLKIYEDIWLKIEELFNDDELSNLKDEFFIHYLTFVLKGNRPNKNNLYSAFKKHFKIEHENKEKSITDICKNILYYAKIFRSIILVDSNSPQLNKLYGEIKGLNLTLIYPILFLLHQKYREEAFDSEKLCSLIKLCISYVVRIKIIGLGSSPYKHTFTKILSGDSVNYEEILISQDKKQKFPTNEEFLSSFISKKIYKEDKFCKYILTALLNYHNKKDPVDTEHYTIEHILPQNENLSIEWQNALGENWQEKRNELLHTIGNLTLTPYNSELGDKPFKEKLNLPTIGYKESALALNSYIVKQEEWNTDKIKERSKELAELALQIWSYPQTNQ